MKKTPKQSGENNSRALLSEAEVRLIRSRFASGELQKHIASDYGIAQSQVSAIVTRKKWKCVK